MSEQKRTLGEILALDGAQVVIEQNGVLAASAARPQTKLSQRDEETLAAAVAGMPERIFPKLVGAILGDDAIVAAAGAAQYRIAELHLANEQLDREMEAVTAGLRQAEAEREKLATLEAQYAEATRILLDGFNTAAKLEAEIVERAGELTKIGALVAAAEAHVAEALDPVEVKRAEIIRNEAGEITEAVGRYVKEHSPLAQALQRAELEQRAETVFADDPEMHQAWKLRLAAEDGRAVA